MNTVNYWQPGQVEQVQEVGLYLQQQRKARDLSVDAVSEKTRIRSGLIAALESGHVEDLPEPIYLRGFVKRYAEFLGLDGDSVAVSIPLPAVVKHSPTSNAPIRIHNAPTPPKPLVPSKLLLGAGTIALGLGMTYGIWHWSQANRAAEPIAVDPQPTVTIVPTVKPDITPQTLTFRVELTGESWVELTIDGEEVLYETLGTGYTQTWTVEQEAALVAAQSENVSISVNGSKLQPFGAGYKEARFPVKSKP